MKRLLTGIGLGTSFAVVMLVLLCMSVFAMLSVKKAGEDMKLTDKAIAMASSYYEADARVEERLMEIDDLLIAAQIAPDAGYLDWCADNLVTIGGDIKITKGVNRLDGYFNTPVGDGRNILVEFEVPMREPGASRYRVIRWQVLDNQRLEVFINELKSRQAEIKKELEEAPKPTATPKPKETVRQPIVRGRSQ